MELLMLWLAHSLNKWLQVWEMEVKCSCIEDWEVILQKLVLGIYSNIHVGGWIIYHHLSWEMQIVPPQSLQAHWSHYTYLWVWLMILLTSNLESKNTWSCSRWEGVSQGLNNQIFWCSNPSYLQQIVFANKSRWSFVHQKLTRKLTLWPTDPVHSSMCTQSLDPCACILLQHYMLIILSWSPMIWL